MCELDLQNKSDESFRDICEYAIVCKKPNFRHEPNPENRRGEWGPGADTKKYGLQPVNHSGGIIIAKDGKAEIRLNSNQPNRLLFKPVLRSFESPHEDLTDSICHYQTSKKDVVFLTKLPHKGKYTLELFVKDLNKIAKPKGSDGKKDAKSPSRSRDKGFSGEQDDGDPSFENICNYLIKADCGFFDLAPYPPLDNEFVQTGDLTPWTNISSKQKSPHLTARSHPEAVIDPYNEGQMAVTLTADQEAELKASMIRFYQHENEEEDCSDYVYLQRVKRNYEAMLIFPKVGFYKMSLLTQDDRIVHQYLINAVNPDTKSMPFPVPGSNWKNEYQLTQPRAGLLEAGKDVPFLVRVPGAKTVHAEWNDGRDREQLTARSKDPSLWEGNVKTDPRGGGDLKIIADGDDTLLTYKVKNFG